MKNTNILSGITIITTGNIASDTGGGSVAKCKCSYQCIIRQRYDNSAGFLQSGGCSANGI